MRYKAADKVHALARGYERFLRALAGFAGALLTFVLIAIITDVLIRNLGGQPPVWTLPFVEYSLLYITTLMAPWLVRTKGHIVVEALTSALPETVRNWLAHAVYLVCVLICLAFAWYALDLFMSAWIREEMDVRSITLPRTLLFAPMVVSFALMSIEFARYLFGSDSLYSGRIGDGESGV